jgi:hypothetical protein
MPWHSFTEDKSAGAGFHNVHVRRRFLSREWPASGLPSKWLESAVTAAYSRCPRALMIAMNLPG